MPRPCAAPGARRSLRSDDVQRRDGDTGAYVRFPDDFPATPWANVWDDTVLSSRAEAKLYAVQTSAKVAQRCVLMTTDPEDLVLDPTCGSGTTAYVAVQWGRRWITIDTSRVPLAPARPSASDSAAPPRPPTSISPSTAFRPSSRRCGVRPPPSDRLRQGCPSVVRRCGSSVYLRP